MKIAIIYRGPSACDDCSESVGRLLKNPPYYFNITYAGPNEEVDLNPELLSQADVYAYPGGPDLDTAWKELEKHAKTTRNFIRGGGRYMGFCLGAYLAGKSALDLMSSGIDVGSEILQKNAQVHGDEDTPIPVDLSFNASISSRKLEKTRWAYSANQDVAASVTPYGKVFVGLVGPHPEAYELWYEDADIENPEGVQTDIGYDFVKSTVEMIRASKDKTGT